MTKRSMNVFEFIFAVLFLMKITKTGIVADWNWFFVALPLLVNFATKFVQWIVETLNLKRSAEVSIQDYWISRIRKNAVRDFEKSLKSK